MAPTLNISLTPQLERLIKRLVASGRYQTASEAVRAALELLERFEAADPRILFAVLAEGGRLTPGKVPLQGPPPRSRTKSM